MFDPKITALVSVNVSESRIAANGYSPHAAATVRATAIQDGDAAIIMRINCGPTPKFGPFISRVLAMGDCDGFMVSTS